MPYDSSKDKTIKKFPQKTFGLTRIRLTVHQYGDKGDAKLQITRMRRSDEESDEWQFVKLGRLTTEEVAWIAKKLPKVAKWMRHFDENDQDLDEE